MTISRWFIPRMRSLSDKSCRENQNRRFVFNNCFPKIIPFMRKCQKMWCSQRGHKWRHHMAHSRCVLDKQGYMHACACTCPRVRAPTRTHARRHTQTDTYCFCTTTIVSWTRLNITLCVRCLSVCSSKPHVGQTQFLLLVWLIPIAMLHSVDCYLVTDIVGSQLVSSSIVQHVFGCLTFIVLVQHFVSLLHARTHAHARTHTHTTTRLKPGCSILKYINF